MDPIANMFSQIKTAQEAGKSEIQVPFSKFKMDILSILAKNGRIGEFSEVKSDKNKEIKINLLKEATLNLQKISRPGRRYYVSNQKIPRSKFSRGFVIVSTSQGLMTGFEARKKGVGGEILAEVS